MESHPVTGSHDDVKLALLEQKVNLHDTALEKDVFPRLDSLDLWRQRIIGAVSVLAMIAVPVLIAAIKILAGGSTP